MNPVVCFSRAALSQASSIAIALLSLSDLRTDAEVPLPNVERLRSSPVLRHLKPNPVARTAQRAAEGTLRQMHVPEGFSVDLVASEPEVRQPVAFAFDERGRIWIAEAHSYPSKRPSGQGMDRIVILEDSDGDGTFERRKVFTEGLNLISGFEVGYGGVWVGAAPELLFIPDRNRDDKPDGPPGVLLDGFGFQDTHECLNSFLWGPDGWLYGNQGVFNLAHIGKPGAADKDRTELRAGVWRYHPVRHEFEVFANGGSNPWGLDFDEHGQIFMTHCRSYWGRGLTTHVIQGAHFWNQANANYAPFIISDPPAEFPAFRNFLLASARYDHGAGGAGEPGTDAIYGGHSHVGTMIYLGDNWPDEFRGHLFTHNLHGHQINQQVNRRLGSGFDTVHAGRDQFFCSDPKYVAVDLQSGPDGAVYMIDWYDQQHCHNPNNEQWERGNGRVYRMKWDATWKPAKVDLASKSDAELVGMHGHKNEWFIRTARRLLHERAHAGALKQEVIPMLGSIFAENIDPAIRLRGLWSVSAAGHFTDDVAQRALADPDEFVRSWGIQMSAEDRHVSDTLFQSGFLRLARNDPSPVVRLYLASAVQRINEEQAWKLIEALAQHGEDRDDRNLPLLLWHGLAGRMPRQVGKALEVAERTTIPQLADYIYWYAATMDGEPLERAVAHLAGLNGDVLRRRLAGISLAMQSRANIPTPTAWKQLAPALYQHSEVRVQREAEKIAAVFGDTSMFPKLRDSLSNMVTEPALRRHAFAVLGRAQDRVSVKTFVRLLDDPPFRAGAINVLPRFDGSEVSSGLIDRLEKFPAPERAAALTALTGRAAFAQALLKAVADGNVKRDYLTAFHVRALTDLKDAEVDKGVASIWGRIKQSPAEKQTQIGGLEKIFNEAPLWAYDGRAGREHFQKLCAQCHVLGKDGTRLGPELTGAGRNGIRYYLENVVDPNAVVGVDFQMTAIDTKAGDTVSGLIVKETATAVTIRTTTGETVVPKSDIERRALSENSLMPEGLLETLGERERIELLKFLTSN